MKATDCYPSIFGNHLNITAWMGDRDTVMFFGQTIPLTTFGFFARGIISIGLSMATLPGRLVIIGGDCPTDVAPICQIVIHDGVARVACDLRRLEAA